MQNHKSVDPIISKNKFLFKRWDDFNQNSRNKKITNCINFLNNNSKIDKILIGVDNLKQLKEFVKIFLKKEKKKNFSKFNLNLDKNIIDPRKWKTK